MFELVERLPDPVKRRLIAVLPAPVWRRVRVYVHGQSRAQRVWRKARLLQLRWQVSRHGFRDGLRPLDHDGERYLAGYATDGARLWNVPDRATETWLIQLDTPRGRE